MPSATVNGATLSYQWDGTETKPVLVLSNSLTTVCCFSSNDAVSALTG